MSRRALVIGHATDVFDDAWDVREERQTPHGWPVLLGWPNGIERGKGRAGGPRVIITAELAAYLNAQVTPSKMNLPIGKTAIKRICRVLGVSWRDARSAWWDEREGDLLRLTIDQFASLHGVSVGAVSEQHTRRFGPKVRCAYWWAEPSVVQAIKTMPTYLLADHLDICASSARRLRQCVNGGLHHGH